MLVFHLKQFFFYTITPVRFFKFITRIYFNHAGCFQPKYKHVMIAKKIFIFPWIYLGLNFKSFLVDSPSWQVIDVSLMPNVYISW